MKNEKNTYGDATAIGTVEIIIVVIMTVRRRTTLATRLVETIV